MQRDSQGQRVRWWVLASAALMGVGAFGPWVKALGLSVSGTDGSNDGWLVAGAAAIGGLLFYALRARRSGGVWALLGGLGGIAVTAYDRSNLQHAIDSGGALAAGLVQVGWGLNLALAASISMAVAAFVHLVRPPRMAAAPLVPFSPPEETGG